METNSWHSYPSSYNLGHRAVKDLLSVPHYIEEKVDGSQFSMGLFEVPEHSTENFAYPAERVLRIRSKGAEMNIDAPEKMFTKAAETARRLASPEARAAGLGLTPGWTYRCEYLRVPKHNTLAYDRVPANNLILFDVNTGDQEFLSREQLVAEGARIGLEVVPMLHHDTHGGNTTLEDIRNLLETTSVLGGNKIEGVVIKQFGFGGYLYGLDHKTLIGKFVSEKFREAHVGAWKESNPTSGDILLMLGAKYQHHGRWMKALQHLREAGKITDSPKDIGALIIEVQKDLGKEEKEEIKTLLWRWANPHIMRMATRGVAEWYKEELLRRQFEQEQHTDDDMMAKSISVEVGPTSISEFARQEEELAVELAAAGSAEAYAEGTAIAERDPGDENDYQEPSSASR